MTTWQSVKVSDLGRIVTGKTPKTAVSENYGGDIPFLTPSDDMSVKYVNSTAKTLTERGVAEVKNALIPPDSVCVSCIGSDLGKVVITTERTVTNQQINSIVVNKELFDVSFIYYAMLILGKELNFISKTSTAVPIVNKSAFSSYGILCPSLEQQKEIAAILSAFDSKIECNKKINDNLQQQAQAIYRERFEGVTSEDLPSGWRIVALGDVATISNKSFNPLKEAERMLEHYSIPAFDEARFPVFEPSTSIKSNKFVIDASCFMISKLNPTTKRVWKPYCLTENAVCSTEFIVYKAKDESITDFLYSVIDSSSFSDFMCSHVTGSTGSRQRTTPSDTLAYELILPSEEDLAEFQSLVSPMYAQMRINAIENDKLKRLRDSLLPKLMSGEVDVSDIQL